MRTPAARLWRPGPVPGDHGSLERAEVVIIGGGVMGCSIAYHLAAAGVRDVVLLEGRELATGSSGKPLGGVRAQFSSRANVLLGARSLEAYRRFPAALGTDVQLEQVGYLFLLRTASEVAGFEAAVALQNELGVPSRLIEPAEACRLNPYLNPDGLLAAAFSPDDGYANPSSVVRGYAAAALARGAELRTGTPVIGLERDGDRLTGVRTVEGVIATGAVICAAGAWSAAIGAMAGVELPVEPLRRQIAFTPPLDPRPPIIPFTIDYGSTAYFHPGAPAGTLLMGVAVADQPAGFDTGYDESWHPALRAALARCAPALAGVRLERGWAGLYEMTPDCDALIGEAPGVERFLYACGFSGHGFVQAPAAGELVRDLYLGAAPFCDPAPFDAARFTAGAARTELTII